jgi:hypothetical protein
MSAKPYRFTTSEIRRAVDTLKIMGYKVTGVEIGKDGRIAVAVDDSDAKPRPARRTSQDLKALV